MGKDHRVKGQNHPKGWNRHNPPGYVKSHNAVKNGASRRAQEVIVLSDEEHAARHGWQPAPKGHLELSQDEQERRIKAYLKDLAATTGGTVYLPPRVNPDGTIKNIRQFAIKAEGPEQGHWANINGKRIWIEGQHNYPRQMNPRTHEHVEGTQIMNRNTKLVELGDVQRNELTGKTYVRSAREFDADARIIRYGKVVSVKKAPGWDGMAAKAFDRAAKHIKDKTANFFEQQNDDNLAPVKPSEAQVQGGAGIANDFVGSEAHV